MGESNATFHPDRHVRPFEPGTRVIHIGPHKTGTTAVQGSLHAARERLGEHGVWLPSPRRNPVDEVKDAVASRPADPTRPAWRRLTEAVARTGDRVGVVSSEFFADADAEACGRVVDGLGGPSVRVVVTLRPLARIMPSQWQQHVQSGMSTRYADWLAELLREDSDDTATNVFWHRHRHDRFVERWAEAAGPEHVTVLVVDDRERDRLLRDFEAVLGLPEHLLSPAKNAGNRSLTAAETEAVRQCAAACAERGWSKAVFRKYVRYGVVPRIKTGRTPPPDEARIATPDWALERAAEIGSAIADRLADSGVRVIGDLDVLRGKYIEPAEPGDDRLDASVAAEAVLGCMSVAMRESEAAEPEADRHRSSSLLKTVAQRARARLAGHRD
ncbi:hypothetical protein [Glycomyces tarimensis]